MDWYISITRQIVGFDGKPTSLILTMNNLEETFQPKSKIIFMPQLQAIIKLNITDIAKETKQINRKRQKCLPTSGAV